MRLATAIGAALVLAACSSNPNEVTPEPTSYPAITQSAAPPPTPIARDQCGAAELQALIGKPRSEIPIPIDPAKQRVACTTCPVTMDFSPERLNFFFDAATGLIKDVRCG